MDIIDDLATILFIVVLSLFIASFIPSCEIRCSSKPTREEIQVMKSFNESIPPPDLTPEELQMQREGNYCARMADQIQRNKFGNARWHLEAAIVDAKMTNGHIDWQDRIETVLKLIKDAERENAHYLGQRREIKKGWNVKGIFEDNEKLHGLIYNPHIKTWFYVCWDLRGKCLTGNCRDGMFDLITESAA